MATDRALIANAETAQELAPALLEFQAHVPEAATEITALASDLYAISAALLELKTALSEPRNYRNKNLVDEDKYVVLRSLEYTFKDTQHYLRGLKSRAYRSARHAYTDVWIQIDAYFRSESHNSLLTRLGYYKHFIDDLTPIVEGRHPSPDVDILFNRINQLLSVQDDRLAQDLENLTVGAPRVPSYERVRDRPAASPGTGPGRNRGGGRAGAGRPGPQSPYSPVFDEFFPNVPDPSHRTPSSPSVATSSTVTDTVSTPPSSAGSGMYDHWLPNVFHQSRPTTAFERTGTESRCYGEHKSKVADKLRSNNYDELLRVPFEAGQLEVRLYSRDSDRKSRMFCRVERGRRPTSCRSVSDLRVVRKDSNLQFCEEASRRRWIMWANLRFPSYERLVLFHSAFIALKAQDESDGRPSLDSHILDDERAVFSAVIIDDDFNHALQILKDQNSGGMRLQASVLRGPMKRAPVWTAFINYRIASLDWAKRVEPRKVHLGDLQRYIFSPDYVPQLGPRGEHEILFTDSRDVDTFLQTVEDLAEKKI